MSSFWLHVVALSLPLVLFGSTLWSVLASSRKAATVATRRLWLVTLAVANGLSWVWTASLFSKLIAKGHLDTELLRASLTIGVPLFICLMLPVFAQAWWHRKS